MVNLNNFESNIQVFDIVFATDKCISLLLILYLKLINDEHPYLSNYNR